MQDFIKANYHAHTWRCQHAYDTEREYIEAAIEMGIKEFGFSDHVPCPFRDGYVSGIRMTMEQADLLEEWLRKLQDVERAVVYERTRYAVYFGVNFMWRGWTEYLCGCPSPVGNLIRQAQ